MKKVRIIQNFVGCSALLVLELELAATMPADWRLWLALTLKFFGELNVPLTICEKLVLASGCFLDPNCSV